MQMSEKSKLVLELVKRHPELGEIEAEIGGGLSDSFVFLMSMENERKVLKIQKDRTEIEFYQILKPKVQNHGTWLPDIFAFGEFDGWNWVLIEYVEHPWPQERFTFDVEAINLLRDLHNFQPDLDHFNWVDQSWSMEHLDAAAVYLPDSTIRKLRSIHERYSQIKDENRVLCSGDPNAPNWMVRENGSIVLLDWQQVCFENRALDLAGWLATMVNFDDMVKVSSIYLSGSVSQDFFRLAKDIAIYFCRRCVTNFWRAEQSNKPELWIEGNKWMANAFPEWLDALMSDVELRAYE